MVASCAAPDCKERFKKNGPTFHRFPLTRKRLLKEWVAAIKREGFQPNKNSYLCAKHFRLEDYENSHLRNKLKPDAVPCLFFSPTVKQKKILSGEIQVRQEGRVPDSSDDLHLCLTSIALDHPYSVQQDDQFVQEPMIIEKEELPYKKLKASKRLMKQQEQKMQKMVDDFYCNGRGGDATCQMLNPWQSRVIEACFLIPVICDLEEQE